MEKRSTYKNIITYGWFLSMTIILVAIFILGNIKTAFEGFTAVLTVVMGCSFFFFMLKAGFERRRFKAMIGQSNSIMKIYHANQNIQQAIDAFKELLATAQNINEEDFLHYHLGHMFWLMKDTEQAKEYLNKVTGFPMDAALQEDFLKLKEKVFNEE